MDSLKTRNLLALTMIIILGVLVWGLLSMPDQRSTGQRIGDAIDTLPQGADKAARQLERRSPGERLGDAVKDATKK